MNGVIGTQPQSQVQVTAAAPPPKPAPAAVKPDLRLTPDQVTTTAPKGMAAATVALGDPAPAKAATKSEPKPWGIRSINFHYSPMVVGYAPSTMHFTQPGYGTDLTIKDVHAKQRTSFDAFYNWPNGYLQIDEPQSSWSLGAQFNNGYGVEANIKHNKYTIPDLDQQREFSGTVGGQPVSGKHPVGDYLQQYEICTGLNEVSIEATKAFQLPAGKKDRFELISKVGPSIYVDAPRSRIVNPSGGIDVQTDGNNAYQVDGFGATVENELRYEFRRHVSVSVAHAVSYANLNSVPIPGGNAKQQIWSNQFSVGLGYTINTHKKH